jgi:hypothetical protein
MVEAARSGRSPPVASLSVIVTAVVCPHPPALLRELGGARDALPELRAACHQALRAAWSADIDRVAVVGGAAESGAWEARLPIGLRRFGTTQPLEAEYLPQSLGVARRLLDEAGWAGPVDLQAVAWAASREIAGQTAATLGAAGDRVLLLVMADGSARRGEKAPGHLDERAFAFDDEIGRALRTGDPEALVALDADLAADLLVQGRTALAVLGQAAAARGARPKSWVVYRDDPYGVMYTVAVWKFGHG